MSNVDVNRDAPRLEPNAIDPTVKVPAHVLADAARAEALHKAAYAPAEPTPEEKAANEATAVAKVAEDAKAANEAAAAAEAERSRAAEAAAQSGTVPDKVDPDADKHAALGTADQERGRYLSMKGRHDALQRQLTAQEEQMRQLAVELTRTQNLLSTHGAQTPSPQPAKTGTDHKKLITDEDIQNYGTELIDVARRAGLEAVGPELEALRADNARLTQAVRSSGKKELFQILDQRLPQWRQINNTVQFKAWLALPNLYTRQARHKMLQEAVAGANAPVVLSLFNDFLREAGVTSQAPAATTEQPLAPHVPAISLESLAAPGRARPAACDTQVAGEKPIYSRRQIAANYEEHRKGLWNHRLDAWNQLEADMIAGTREGRVR